MIKISNIIATIVSAIFLSTSIIVHSKPDEKELATFKEELDKKLSVKIDQEPLDEFFIRLRKICKIPIVTSSKVNLQKIVQISFADIAVKDAIYWVCKKNDLDFEIKRGALYFLDLDESLKKNVIFKTYDIQFLQQIPLENKLEFLSPVENIYGGSTSITSPLEDDEGDPVLFIGKEIDQIIKNKIPDGHWNSSETLIEISGNFLRVKNIPEVQEKVEGILKYYYQKFGIQVQSEVIILSVPKKEFNEYILNELKGSNILSAEELKEFQTKKRLLWKNQKLLFSGSTVSYNSFLTKISILNTKDALSDFNVCDSEYDATILDIYSEEGISVTPLINKEQSEIILTISGQYSSSLEVNTPKLDLQNPVNSIDKIQMEVARFSTSAQIKNDGGVLISMGSNALKDMGDQLLIFCITSKIIKK